MHFSSLLSLAAVTGFSLPYTSAAVLPRQATNGSAELTFYPVNGPSDGVKLTGVRDATSGTDAYTSIPYAKPPIGDLRWQHPSPPEWTSSTYNATQTIPTCLQAPNRLAGGNGSANQEDCLYLNVYTPAGVTADDGAELPVFMWVYGGSFVAGSAATYDPRILMGLAQKTSRPFVAVIPNYRLGVLGFPYGKEAAANQAGNLGIRDIQLALEWTRDNIGAFGGDPSRVTLAGESAGGIITNLLLLQQDTNLFRSAIVQSGGVSVSPIGPIATTWQEPFDLLAQTAGCLAKSDNATTSNSSTATASRRDLNSRNSGILPLPQWLREDLEAAKEQVKVMGQYIRRNNGGQKPSTTTSCSSAPESTPSSGTGGDDGSEKDVWACLKSKSAEEILAAQVTVQATPAFAGFIFAPSIDGDLIPESPHTLITEGKFRPVPLLIGNVKDEGTGFTPTTLAGDEAVAFVIDINLPRDPSNETIARIYELYPNDTSLGSPYDTGNETFGLDPQWKRAASVLGDVFQASRRYQCEQQVALYPNASVYAYFFNQSTPNAPPYAGVYHGSDVAYTFGLPLLGGNYTATDQAFTLQMNNYWINFINSQSPNSPAAALPAWPTYNGNSTGKGNDANLLRLQYGSMDVIQDTYREEAIAYRNSEPEQFNLKRDL